MTKKFPPILIAVCLLCFVIYPCEAQTSGFRSTIKRLTHSGNHTPLYPCLSENGKKVLYVLEINEGETVIKSIHILDIETGEDKELFRSGTKPAPPPFDESPLCVGTKPPQLSGNGRLAVFSLSVGEPPLIPDHFLAVVNSDGSDFRLFSFPIKALEGKDLKSMGLESGEWERLSNYAIDTEGTRMVCVVKGHMGPRRLGNPSGIVALKTDTHEQRTLLAPNLVDEKWTWKAPPQKPLTGGGWGLGLSGDGQKVLFGAQSSDDLTDYDLYTMDWQGNNIEKVTDFHDRWFSLVDISGDGNRIVFYYTGQKKQGIGTYLLQEKSGQAVYLQSRSGSPVGLFDLSGNGLFIVYKRVYKGMRYDVKTGTEQIIFDENTSGYAAGSLPMDFPQIPSFWCPKIMSFEGDRILLVGFPQGKTSPEIYILYLEK